MTKSEVADGTSEIIRTRHGFCQRLQVGNCFGGLTSVLSCKESALAWRFQGVGLEIWAQLPMGGQTKHSLLLD